MNDQQRDQTICSLFELSPLFRKMVMRPMEAPVTEMPPTQLFALMALKHHELLNMTQLAEEVSVSNQQLTKIVDALVEKDLVERVSDQLNRRVVLIQLTEQGKVFLEERRQKMMKNLKNIFAALSDEDMEILYISSNNIIQIIERNFPK